MIILSFTRLYSNVFSGDGSFSKSTVTFEKEPSPMKEERNEYMLWIEDQ